MAQRVYRNAYIPKPNRLDNMEWYRRFKHDECKYSPSENCTITTSTNTPRTHPGFTVRTTTPVSRTSPRFTIRSTTTPTMFPRSTSPTHPPAEIITNSTTEIAANTQPTTAMQTEFSSTLTETLSSLNSFSSTHVEQTSVITSDSGFATNDYSITDMTGAWLNSTSSDGLVPNATTEDNWEPGLPSMTVYNVYIAIVFTGVFLNICAIVAICFIRRLRKPQNIFVLNLCFADILIHINAITQLIREIDDDFDNEIICPIIGFVTFIPPVAIVLSMCVIAENRFEVITLNRRDVTTLRIAISLIFVWSVSIIVSLPILLGDMEVHTNIFCYCCFYFASNVLYGIHVTVFMYIIPNIAIATFYISIIVHVRKSRQRIAQQTTSGSHLPRAGAKKGDIFLARQFIILFSVFNICYIPAMVVSWIEDEQSSVSAIVRSFVVILFSCNLIANPVLYFIMNRNAKKAVKQQFECCKKNKGKLPHDAANGNLHPANIFKLDSLVKDSPAKSENSTSNLRRKRVLSLRTQTLQLEISKRCDNPALNDGDGTSSRAPKRKISWLDAGQNATPVKRHSVSNNDVQIASIDSSLLHEQQTTQTPVKSLRRQSNSYNDLQTGGRRKSVHRKKSVSLRTRTTSSPRQRESVQSQLIVVSRVPEADSEEHTFSLYHV